METTRIPIGTLSAGLRSVVVTVIQRETRVFIGTLWAGLLAFVYLKNAITRKH